MALRPVAKDGGGLRPFYTNTSHLLKVYIGRVVCVCGLRIFGERLMPTKNISTYPKKRGNILLETKSTNGLKKLPRQTHHTTDILPFLVVHESFMRQKAGVFFTWPTDFFWEQSAEPGPLTNAGIWWDKDTFPTMRHTRLDFSCQIILFEQMNAIASIQVR